MVFRTMAPLAYVNKRLDLVPQVIIRGKLMEKTELRLFFEKHDRNNDGVLDKDELTAAFRRLGAAQPAKIASWGLHFADRNRDGRISISEQEIDQLTNCAFLFGYRVR